MAITDRKFELLNIQKQKRYKNKGFKMKENTGLDTETYKGYVKLICDDMGNYKLIDNIDDILAFLTHERYRNKFNWFFNIQYDFESIIKYLDYEDLVLLYENGDLKYSNYEISYIPKKFFSIRYVKNNQYYHFYDLYNFIESSLQNAAIKFLNDKKMSDVVDSARLNVDLDYWKENEKIIIEYCIKDSLLTKKIADYFWGVLYKNLKFVPKRPYSKGKISEEYFTNKLFIPTINKIPEIALEYGYNSYSGGRFELLKRGYQEHVYCYDISSAYPSQIANLIDYSKGRWEKVTNNKISKNAYTGYYYCSIDVMEPFFSPVMQKIGGLNIYPNGKFNLYLSKWEYDFIKLNFENVNIKIKRGVEFFEKELDYPFKQEIERLYEWKQKEKDETIKYAVKIFLNSLYGKFIQVSKNYQTGKLFNPIWASEITAKTRVKLLEMALQKPYAMIYFSTDGIASTEKLRCKSKNKVMLGDFAPDFEGEGVFIMSDVYNLWNDLNGKTKNRLRGFSFKISKEVVKDKTKDNEVLLIDILRGMDKETIYSYFTMRPHHLGECLLHHKILSKDDINIFDKVNKSIDVNGDKKRLWEKNFSCGAKALEECHNSVPMVI